MPPTARNSGQSDPKGPALKPYTPPGLIDTPGGGRPDEPNDLAREADIWFFVALTSTLCCCIFGITGAVLAQQAKTLASESRVDEAESKLRAAKVFVLFALALGLLGLALHFAGFVFGAVF